MSIAISNLLARAHLGYVVESKYLAILANSFSDVKRLLTAALSCASWRLSSMQFSITAEVVEIIISQVSAAGGFNSGSDINQSITAYGGERVNGYVSAFLKT